MTSLNKVQLIGRLGQDPEINQTQSGHSVMNIGIATTEYGKNPDGSKREETEWHNLTFWNRLAEIVQQYCRKGSLIYVEGKLKTETWEDRQGGDRRTTKVIVGQLKLLSPKSSGESQSGRDSYGGYGQQTQAAARTQPPSGYAGGTQTQTSSDELVEDDIPF